MKTILFNGGVYGAHSARYKIIHRKSKTKYLHKEVVVFVVQELGDGASLINDEVGRNQIINRILKNNLSGIELSNIKFIYQWQSKENNEKYRNCREYFLDYDHSKIPHWKEPRSPVLRFWHRLRKKEISVCWLASNVIAGKIKVITNFKKCAYIPEDEVKALLKECEDSDPSAPPSLSPDLRAMLRNIQPPSSSSH